MGTVNKPTPPALEQISISLSLERNGVAPASSVSIPRCESETEAVIEAVLKKSGGPLAMELHSRIHPFHVCISQQVTDQIRGIHNLLVKALIDIVQRWFIDVKANFPGKMPVEPHEEELLRWMDGSGRKHFLPYGEAYGIWRTDLLFERAKDGSERAKICEINARLPYNGFWLTGMQMETTELLRKGSDQFVCPDDFQATKRAIFGRFDKTKPLHNVREKWPSIDSPHLLREWEAETGSKTYTIKPSQLRSREDLSSPTGRTLYYVPENDVNGYKDSDNESLETDIAQCSLELLQKELRVIDTDTLHQLATCCTNDFRDILLIHDKRLLGILREELLALVTRGVLTEHERNLLEEATIETLIPGAPKMKDLLTKSKTNNDLRKEYIVKPVRDGNGVGIQLGRDIPQEEWLELLERLSIRPLLPSEDAYVVQRMVDHIWYDAAIRYQGGLKVMKCHFVGSYHLIGSELGVFGPWRLGKDVTLGRQFGSEMGCFMCCVTRPKGWSAAPGKEE